MIKICSVEGCGKPNCSKGLCTNHYEKFRRRGTLVIMAINVGMNFWGEEIYRKVAKAHFKHRRLGNVKMFTAGNLFTESSSHINRKH